jgi:hypothetical protein
VRSTNLILLWRAYANAQIFVTSVRTVKAVRLHANASQAECLSRLHPTTSMHRFRSPSEEKRKSEPEPDLNSLIFN